MYESFTGQSTLHVCKQLVSHFKLEQAPQTLVNIKRNHFKRLFFSDLDLQLIDGVLDCIEDYHKNGLTLVLASSASMLTINKVFTRFKLDQYFKAKLSGANLKASKPHPEIFLKAVETSGYKKEECMVIEDSTNGIKAAHEAGIYCVAFKSANSKNQDYTLANKLIGSFDEITYDKLMQLD